jgi:hypothetical protein
MEKFKSKPPFVKICECGHSLWDHVETGKKPCKAIVPNNFTTHKIEKYVTCKCKIFDLAIDLEREDIHVKPFGSAY